jgi:hypothetical protein
MKTFEYRKFQGIVTCRHQVAVNLWRVTLSVAWLSEYVGPLRWLTQAKHLQSYARWSHSIWIHRLGFGVAVDFVGLNGF